MSHILERDRYPAVQSLFTGMHHHLAAVTVLAGVLPGRVYVADPASPRTAILIPSNQHRVYLSGEPSAPLLADVIRQLGAAAREEGYGCVLYYDAARDWRPTIEQALHDQELTSAWRQYYRLSAPSASALAPLPDHVTLGAIDRALVDGSLLAHREELGEEIVSESPSLDHFFRHNFGLYARDERQFIGWCLAEYHDQGRYELGIETIEAYQRKGVATHLADAVIRRAFDLGATEIGWHCWARNTPSVATALKLGFEKALDYPVMFCEYQPSPA